MRAPSWLRLTGWRRTPGDSHTVTVTLELDDSAFVDAMHEAAEGLSRNRYRQRIRHERSLGLAYVGMQLDGLCADVGLNPVQAWRIPRAAEEAERWRGIAR